MTQRGQFRMAFDNLVQLLCGPETAPQLPWSGNRRPLRRFSPDAATYANCETNQVRYAAPTGGKIMAELFKSTPVQATPLLHVSQFENKN